MDEMKKMTVKEMTDRVNELYHKSQREGLTDAEKKEQAELRKAYVANIRANLRAQLDNISIVEKDGSVTKPGKKNVRKRILSLRNEIPLKLREEKSNKILRTLYGIERYKEADIILAYVDYQSEVITTPLLVKALKDNKRVFTPRVSGEEMEFYRITGTEDLAEGYKGIREPICGAGFMEETESYKSLGENASGEAAGVLMLMPGVVFDKDGHRIGYGKGFYDRYLERLSEAGINIYKIALCYECQMLSEIPNEEHDISVDMVITENGIYENGIKIN